MGYPRFDAHLEKEAFSGGGDGDGEVLGGAGRADGFEDEEVVGGRSEGAWV